MKRRTFFGALGLGLFGWGASVAARKPAATQISDEAIGRALADSSVAARISSVRSTVATNAAAITRLMATKRYFGPPLREEQASTNPRQQSLQAIAPELVIDSIYFGTPLLPADTVGIGVKSRAYARLAPVTAELTSSEPPGGRHE